MSVFIIILDGSDLRAMASQDKKFGYQMKNIGNEIGRIVQIFISIIDFVFDGARFSLLLSILVFECIFNS
jgi:hypothetical protein